MMALEWVQSGKFKWPLAVAVVQTNRLRSNWSSSWNRIHSPRGRAGGAKRLGAHGIGTCFSSPVEAVWCRGSYGRNASQNRDLVETNTCEQKVWIILSSPSAGGSRSADTAYTGRSRSCGRLAKGRNKRDDVF